MAKYYTLQWVVQNPSICHIITKISYTLTWNFFIWQNITCLNKYSYQLYNTIKLLKTSRTSHKQISNSINFTQKLYNLI